MNLLENKRIGYETNFHFSPYINLILNIITFQALIRLTAYWLL